jgi:hypothetical protein
LLFDFARLEFCLAGVAEVLPWASAAGLSVGTRWSHAKRRGSDHPIDAALKEVFVALYDANVDDVAGSGSAH